VVYNATLFVFEHHLALFSSFTGFKLQEKGVSLQKNEKKKREMSLSYSWDTRKKAHNLFLIFLNNSKNANYKNKSV